MYETLAFLALLSSAMLAGLMATLVTAMNRMWARQDEREAARSFQAFLGSAASNRVLSTLSVLPVISSGVLVFLDAPEPRGHALAVAGGIVFLLGFFVWTGVVNAPIYRAVQRWDIDRPEPPARVLLRRFRTANLVRLAATVAAAALFFLAA